MSRKKRKKKQTVTVVTISDLRRTGATCDCGSPLKIKQRGPQRLKLGKLKGFGKHCVVDDKDQVVRCFHSRKVAKKVARGFGSGFRVETG